jgi:leader peptidase (prepilin peptidase)/N-methyltransferase
MQLPDQPMHRTLCAWLQRTAGTQWAFLLVGIAGAAVSVVIAPGLGGLFGAGLALLMAWIAITDARRFRIPDGATAAGLGLGLLNAAFIDPEFPVDAIARAGVRAALLAFAFWSLREIYLRLRKLEGIGLGDVKLAGVAGAWLEWSTIAISIEIAALTALVFYAIKKFAGGRAIKMTSRVPFGLFLAPAIWVGWLLEAMLAAVPWHV